MESVPAGGPADKAGIKDGDIIVALNGKPIRDGDELVDRVTSTPIGTTVTVTVLRERQARGFPRGGGRSWPRSSRIVSEVGKQEEAGPAEGTQARFGIMIENLTDARRDNMGIKQHGCAGQLRGGEFVRGRHRHAARRCDRRDQPPAGAHDRRRETHPDRRIKPGEAVAFRILRQAGRGEWSPLFLAGSLPNHP